MKLDLVKFTSLELDTQPTGMKLDLERLHEIRPF